MAWSKEDAMMPDYPIDTNTSWTTRGLVCVMSTRDGIREDP
jgi:hypothetical protein